MGEPSKIAVKAEGAPAPAARSRHPFESLRREIDRVFESFPGAGLRWPFGRFASDIDLTWPGEGGWSVSPAVDVTEQEKAFQIVAELPGVDEKDLQVKLANGVLTIRGEKKEECERGDADYHLSERRYGSFVRSFQLPAGVDAEHIEASFARGVLTVTLPKTPAAQQAEKKIAVKAAP